MTKMTKKEWLEANGFSREEVTYIVLGNSYPIKDKLKEAGFKYSALLRWHAATADFELPEDCQYFPLHYSDFMEWDEEGQASFFQPGARDMLEQLFNPRTESHSQHVGAIGDKIVAVMKLRYISGYDSPYGYKYVYTFEDEIGNVFSWFTTVQQPYAAGATVNLTGTIKSHSDYKGVKTTVLTRCRLHSV